MTLLKNVYKAKIKTIADKIPDNTNRDSNTAPKAKIKVLKKKYLVLLTSLHAKINKVKNKILNTTKLATTIVFTAVENKIPNVSNLVKKTDNKTKINEIENKKTTYHDHDKCITTQEFNKFTTENFTARLKKANLACENDISSFVKNTDFDNKVDIVTSYKNELDELSKNVKAVSSKNLTKDLTNKFSILNGAKYLL